MFHGITQTVSTVSAVLAALRTYCVGTLSWMAVASGVSGLAENVVLRASGLSGDKVILLKFGASTAAQESLSVFGCLAFDSATQVATTPSSAVSWGLGSGPWSLALGGDADHVFLGVSGRWLYAGLPSLFASHLSAVPNRTMVFSQSGPHVLVDNDTPGLRLGHTPSALWNATTPEPSTGRYLLWPILVYESAVFSGVIFSNQAVIHGSDAVFGTLKGLYTIGSGASGWAFPGMQGLYPAASAWVIRQA